MAARAAAPSGRYLYAIVTAPGEPTYGFAGIDGAPVYTIANGQVAAVVSDVLNDRIRPERRHLAAQQAVLKGLLSQADAMLPMAFGIIADGPKAIQKILSRNHEAFLKQLQRVAGMVEMGLRVSWDVPNIFEYFVNTHKDLRSRPGSLSGASTKTLPRKTRSSWGACLTASSTRIGKPLPRRWRRSCPVIAGRSSVTNAAMKAR